MLSPNEWDLLKEVIIGNVTSFHMEDLDKVFLNIYGYLRNFQGTDHPEKKHHILKKFIDERQEDLDNLAKVLENEGVKVMRTKNLKKKNIVTPEFNSTSNDCGCVRDMFLVLNNQIIESPPTDRRRYFEALSLYEIFKNYFIDKKIKWISAPKPSLSEKSIDFSNWKEEPQKKINTPKEIQSNIDISFDAANCLRFGKDILMNVGNKNHELGGHWLQRILGSDYKVHMVRLTDSHLDGLIMPISKDTLLINEEALKERMHLLPSFLNDWKKIPIEDNYSNFDYPEDHLQLSSFRGMDTNVLPLGNKKIIIRDSAVKTIKRLESEGFKPIPIRLRHCELFGGGPHCVTLDTIREKDESSL